VKGEKCAGEQIKLVLNTLRGLRYGVFCVTFFSEGGSGMSCSRSCPNGKTNKQEPRVTDSQPARQTDGQTDGRTVKQPGNNKS